jgi:ATP-dependent DNA ligase
MRTWPYPSSSDASKTYTVTLADNGHLGCNCRGWTIRKPGKPRECSHTKDVVAQHGFVLEARGDYFFVVSTNALTSAPIGNIITPDGGKAPATTEGQMAKAATATDISNGFTAPAAQLASGMTKPLIGEAFDKFYGDGNWMMDEKLDGHRCLVVKRGDKVGAFNRGASAKATALPQHLVDALLRMPDGIYDGELVAPGGNSWNVTELTKQDSLALVLFDILEVLGENVMGQPHTMRRQLLATAIGPAAGTAVMLVAEFKPEWAIVEKIWAGGGEGVILKKINSTYRPGARTDAWVKVKQLHSMVGVITGFEAGSFGPHSVTLLKLSNGVDGRVKTLNHETLAEIAKNPASWIGRRLVIQYQQLTPSGSPRHAMWDHLAGDAE